MCLQELLWPAGDVAGCLTPSAEVRLFRHLAELSSPWVERTTFDQARQAADTLRGWVAPGASSTATLGEVCARLGRLGEFARQVEPVLAGPGAGPHRRWATILLTNFRRLGQLAACLASKESAGHADRQDEPADAEAMPPAPEAVAPTVARVREVLALARQVQSAARGRWREPAEAARSLAYPVSRFRENLARAAGAPEQERGRLIEEAARQLADELMNKIRRLDALLAGGVAPGRPELPADLMTKLRALRERVFQVMAESGGYEECPLMVGDSIRRHTPSFVEVSYVSGPRYQADEIVQIVEPGYVRRRQDGQVELIRPAKVVVAR
jgi:hypothetical protein